MTCQVECRFTDGPMEGKKIAHRGIIGPSKMLFRDMTYGLLTYYRWNNPSDDVYEYQMSAGTRRKITTMQKLHHPTPEKEMSRLDPLKKYVPVTFLDGDRVESMTKQYTIELAEGVFDDMPAPGDLLVAHIEGRFTIVKVVALEDDEAIEDLQQCRKFIAIGTANVDTWTAEQNRAAAREEAREIMKRARTRYVEQMDFSNLKGLMTPEERAFVAEAFNYEDTLDKGGLEASS